jgi:hypothetical protein
MRGGDRRERKLDLDPRSRGQDNLAFNHARDRIPGALVLTQRFSHRALSRPHKRAGVKTEIAVTLSTGFRLSVSGRCLSHGVLNERRNQWNDLSPILAIDREIGVEREHRGFVVELGHPH